MSAQTVLIAQISDLHIKAQGKLSYGKVDTLGALHKAIATLNQLQPRPDCVVITGDLVDFGRADEYQTLREALEALDIPWYVMAGNHDDRQQLKAAFADHPYLDQHAERVEWQAECGPLRLLALDSSVPGQPHGELVVESLAWLDQQLQLQPHRPTLVMLHHPPFISGIDHMDRQRLINPQDLAAIIVRHPQVERVLCGHLHRSMQVRFAGTLACSAPGASHQVALDLQPDGPAHFCLEPAGFLLHRWREQQGMVTHQCVIDKFPGPWPFYSADGALLD
ncbi:3',5'-cyclic AMP phosphodiesterase CpdA [Erwinia toletana]|uniref:3',5'-cyclic AMP phosphodiesterase CpdA n=1 Tax=Winslowiella toletana TaxID=92490 RepID=A0ABS4P6T8_9GAMM|nr:phosphodiesterase [Winslowiella toletana]MBP2168366.1 3',5'-cyclic AMP phosphodiesterase CpdA [Winslowiella toletana]